MGFDTNRLIVTEYPMTAMGTVVQADAELLRSFRDLFRLTLDEVEVTRISRSTWARIEQGLETEHRPGVAKRVQQIRRLMAVIGRMPYLEARAWAVQPMNRRGKTPRDLVTSGLFGINELFRHLAAREGDFVIS